MAVNQKAVKVLNKVLEAVGRIKISDYGRNV